MVTSRANDTCLWVNQHVRNYTPALLKNSFVLHVYLIIFISDITRG